MIQLNMNYQQKIFNFNKTESVFPDNFTIQQLFEEQVLKHPGNCAVIFDDEKLTYSELNQKANQLAHYLRNLGVKPDDVIAITAERSLEMIIRIWGIIKSGCAYLPIATDNPIERTNFILSDSKAKFFLTENRDGIKFDFNGKVINPKPEEIFNNPSENPSLNNKPRDLLYIIYTSGSTGKPKGVMIEHISLINRLNWMQKEFPITSNDVLLQKTPFYFDVSVWELFWWSLCGSSMCFLIPGGEKNPFLITDTVKKSGITVMHFVPSMLSVFLEHLENKGKNEIDKLRSLKYLFCSGEALSPSHVKRFNKIFAGRTELINLYGPTEATIDVTYYRCPQNGNIDVVPIGKPIDNIKIFIASNDKIQPIGETGEICITGTGLARGYINNKELTNEKFIECPFLPGQRMYKTGDLGKWLPDGNIEFLGREDFQLKIRGLRIEPGEIENVIRDFKHIKDCVVSFKKYSETIIILTAYIVTRTKIDFNELRSFLKQYLPDYMIPGIFLEIDVIPLTPNGKTDRKALPVPLSVLT